MLVSKRVAARVARDYPVEVQQDVIELLDSICRSSWRIFASDDGRDRVQAAVLKLAGGNIDTLLNAAGEVERDWRDVLVAAGLENEDWPARVAAILGEPR
jgi:hypothetical protein